MDLGKGVCGYLSVYWTIFSTFVYIEIFIKFVKGKCTFKIGMFIVTLVYSHFNNNEKDGKWMMN